MSLIAVVVHGGNRMWHVRSGVAQLARAPLMGEVAGSNPAARVWWKLKWSTHQIVDLGTSGFESRPPPYGETGHWRAPQAVNLSP